MKRRTLLTSLISLLWAGNHSLIAAPPIRQRTPADQEGPYYPVGGRTDVDHDLLQVGDQKEMAQGDQMELAGVVMDTMGQTLAGITVEIWQTDPHSRYMHPNDPSPGERDPHFQYYGRATSDASGGYRFRTLVPGAYRPRPRHIHFKVWRGEELLLTSQIYPHLPGEPIHPAIRPPLRLMLERVGQRHYYGYFEIVI